MLEKSNLLNDYINTEVGVIPKQWKVTTLDQLFDFSGGFTASRDQLSNNGYCYLHYGDIHTTDKTYIDVEKEYIDIPKLNVDLKKISKSSLLNEGDVVFVDASEDDEGVSKHIVIRNNKGIKYISGLHTVVAKSKGSDLDNLYKQFCFKTNSIKKQFKFYAVGTKVSGISKTNIKKILIPIPSINEQKAIATALSDMDDLILSLEKLISKKKLIKEGAMEELLTGKKRLDGFSDMWVERNLDDIVDFTNGKAHENNLVDYGDFVVVNSKFISTCGYVKKYTNEPSCIAQKNDILMVMSDVPNGKAIAKCFIVTEDDKYTVNQRICKLTVKEGYHKYLFYRINRNKYYLSFDDGAKQTNLRRADVLGLKLMLPEYKEQKAIATILSDMDIEIEKLEKKLDKYKNIKSGMMEELLTGKRRLV